jgi:hypothetical protein
LRILRKQLPQIELHDFRGMRFERSPRGKCARTSYSLFDSGF